MSHIKHDRNPKTNLKAKTNPNPKLQKSQKKTLEKCQKFFSANQEFNPRPVEYNAYTVLVHWATKAVNPAANFRSFNIYRKRENAIKNKTNTDPNPTTNPNPNPTIDEAGKRKLTE